MTTRNTGLVANFEAIPQVANNAAELAGVLRTASGTVELLAGDSTDNDIVMLAPIPSNASIPQLFVGADELGGTCQYNVGIYKTDGTVKDEDGNVIQSAGLNKIRIENDYQDSQEIEIDQTHRFRKFRVKLPRDEQGGRFRGTFFKISLFFDNSVNLSLTLQRIMSFFDIQTY